MAARPARRWQLKQLTTKNILDINLRENTMVGRNANAQVCLRSSRSSRKHASFMVNFEGNLVVLDLNSVNGTFVNGSQITEYNAHRVFPGDIISFGTATMDLAEDDRDRQTFYKVLLVEKPPVTNLSVEGAAADSTTDAREVCTHSSIDVVNNSSKSTVGNLQPDLVDLSSESIPNENSPSIIEISSSLDDNSEQIPICSKDTEMRKNKQAYKKSGKPEVSSLSHSLSSIKVPKEMPPSRISSRRRTIEVHANVDEASMKPSTRKTSGRCTTRDSGGRLVDNDSDQLLIELDEAISGNTRSKKNPSVVTENKTDRKVNTDQSYSLQSSSKEEKDYKREKPHMFRDQGHLKSNNAEPGQKVKNKTGYLDPGKKLGRERKKATCEDTSKNKSLNKKTDTNLEFEQYNSRQTRMDFDSVLKVTDEDADVEKVARNEEPTLVTKIGIDTKDETNRSYLIKSRSSGKKDDKNENAFRDNENTEGHSDKKDKTAKFGRDKKNMSCGDTNKDTSLSNKKNANLESEQCNSRPTKIGFDPVSNVLDKRKSFTIDADNSVIIDITNDSDDELDFACSQIFQMSQVFKTEAQDDVYQKIKSELAEMEFCNDELILNTVPIDLENDLYTTGFENTQAICSCLQDGIESDMNNSGAAAKSVAGTSKISTELNLAEITEHDDLMKNISDIHDASGNSKNNNALEVSKKTTIPPIIEPHTMTKKVRQSPRRKANDVPKEGRVASQKRKSSLGTPVKKKKIRASSTNRINPLKYDPKDILLELKRRHSSSNEMDKSEKVTIREERRKKLKELADPSCSKSSSDVSQHKGSSLPEAKSKKTAGKTEESRISEKKKSAKANTTPEFKTSDNFGIGALKQPLPNYNLRRAKSSDDMKLKEKSSTSTLRIPITRLTTSVDVNCQLSAASRVLNDHMEVKPTTRIDPRKPHPTQKPSTNQMAYPNNILPQEASRRLMWTNGGPARRPAPRRLPNVDDIVIKMVQWLPNWLLEQVDIDSSPPVNIPRARKIPSKFVDFNHYYETFSKLVLLENWQYLFKGFRDSTDECREELTQPRKVKIEHVRIINDLMILDCECYITKQEQKRGLFYRPEDFLLLECVIHDKNNPNNCYLSLNFGLIQSCRRSMISNDAVISMKLGDSCPGNPDVKLEFTLVTRYQPGKEVNTRKMPTVKLLANIRAHLMLIKAIKGLQDSPLCPMILSPKVSDYKFTTTHRDIIHSHALNPQQKSIVLEAASLCTGNKPGIYCVKGPPGTGKSTVIVNLVFQILFSYRFANISKKPPMILLTAPSNTAVDNLILRLVALKQGLSPEMRHQIKLVRIGPESSINKDVRGYSLPKLAEKHVILKNSELPQFKAAIKRNENMSEFAKTFFGDQYAHEFKICENLIIEKSNVICTTLNSCINGRLIETVNRRDIHDFTCAITDEATQCHEPEALLPTILGIDKCVLVGDPQQLNATIMNRDAFRLGFHQSLFARLASNFKNDPRSPIRMLRDQYRMHPEICSFPNSQFYENKLRSHAKPVNKLPEEIRPYLVFNLESVNQTTDYTNMDEVLMIKKLLKTIFSMLNKSHKYTVGIITPYNAQKELICKNIVDLTTENPSCKIATNTVDSFQGSENDIVIISCVRDSSNSFLQNANRLNVALTRAKQVLYIIGNYTLFKECRPLYDLREDAKRRKVLLDLKQNPRFIGNLDRFLLRRNSTSSENPL